MCNEVITMMNQENKLVKTNSPAIVVGDVLGNLHDLLQLEQLLWQSFPVVPESLIFLGK